MVMHAITMVTHHFVMLRVMITSKLHECCSKKGQIPVYTTQMGRIRSIPHGNASPSLSLHYLSLSKTKEEEESSSTKDEEELRSTKEEGGLLNTVETNDFLAL